MGGGGGRIRRGGSFGLRLAKRDLFSDLILDGC